MVARVDLIPGVQGLVLGQTWYRENACVWNVKTGWVHAIDDIMFQVKYDKCATLVSQAETETEQPAIAWRVEAVSPERPVEGFPEAETEPLSGIGMIRTKPSTWALSGSANKDSDEDSLDPDYRPEESMDSQSDLDSEDEYIEERARRARNRPVSPAKPGEDTIVPVTAVEQEPVGSGAPLWAPAPNAAAVVEPPVRQLAPRWPSTVEDVESSSVGAAVEVPRWASETPLSRVAPRWSSIRESVESSNAGVAVGVPSWASENQSLGNEAPRWSSIVEAAEAPSAESVVRVPSWALEVPLSRVAPRLEPVNEPVGVTDQTSEQPDVIVVESADGVREEYIVKSEIDSSGEETGVPPVNS